MQNLPELVVSQPEELTAFCEHVAHCPVIGFDTEFIGEQTFHPRLCLVQVATPDRLYLIDPLQLESLAPFWDLVADPRRVSVVHAGREEIRMCRHNVLRPPGDVFDLQIAAGLLGAGYPAGHGTLVHQFLRVRLNKGETLTDWARRPLTRQQIRYAYDDVRYLLPLYERMHKRLAELGRLGWMAEESSAFLKRALADDPEREPWRKLRSLGGLDANQLAVVREVFAWREERAAKLDRPARYMLRDDLIIEIARRMPDSEKDLSVVRGVAKHDVPGLLKAVERGKSTAIENRPTPAERDNDPPQVAIISNLMQSVLASFCAEHRLTPALVATASDVKCLIRARLDEGEIPATCALSSGWRAEHILPTMIAVLDGQTTIRVASVSQAAPLELGKQ